MFGIFGKNSKWVLFWGERNIFFFLKIGKSIFLRYPVGQKEIALSRTVKELAANLCFYIFRNNSKWPPFWGRRKFFENWQEYIFLDTLSVEHFDEIALSCMVKEIEAN